MSWAWISYTAGEAGNDFEILANDIAADSLLRDLNPETENRRFAG